MKTIKTNLAAFLVITGFFICSYTGLAQEAQLSKQEKKAIKKAQAELNFHILDSLVSSRNFVLEADYLRNKYGMNIPVLTSLNFIKVAGENGVLQTGSDAGVGYNGVGGVTAEGKIGTWKIDRDPKHFTITLRFSIVTNVGNYDVLMTVNSSNNASATITGLTPGNLTWDGHLETLDNSGVFKGYNSY
jgi:hypothetical protein